MSKRSGGNGSHVPTGGGKGAVSGGKGSSPAVLATVGGVHLPGGNLPSKRQGAKSGPDRGIVVSNSRS